MILCGLVVEDTRHHGVCGQTGQAKLNFLRLLNPSLILVRSRLDPHHCQGARMFHDCKFAAGMNLGVSHPRKNIQLGPLYQGLFLRARIRVHHICSHSGNAGNEFSDCAADLGAKRLCLHSQCHQAHGFGVILMPPMLCEASSLSMIT